MSLLHQRLESLFEARKRGAPSKRALAAAARKTQREQAKQAKSDKQALSKAKSQVKKKVDSAFSVAVSKLSADDFVGAAQALDRTVPDFQAAKPHLEAIYKATLPYFEYLAVKAALTRGAGAATRFRGEKTGWDKGDMPSRAAKMRQATVFGPVASDPHANKRRKELMRSLAAQADKALGDFAKDAKTIVEKHNRAVENYQGAVQKASKDFTAEVRKADPKTRVSIAPGVSVSMAELSQTKQELRAMKKSGAAPQEIANRQALLKAAKAGFVKAQNEVKDAEQIKKKTSSLYKIVERSTISGGSEGLILPHEIANEFFVAMGLAKGGRTKGKPIKGFYNLVIRWGRALNPQHQEYRSYETVKSALGAIGSAFSMFANNVIRDGGLLKAKSSAKIFALPDGEAVELQDRRGTTGWQARQEDLKTQVGKFIKELGKAVKETRSEIKGSVDARDLAQAYLEESGAQAKAIKRYKSRKAPVKTPQGGRVMLPTHAPDQDDLEAAAKNPMLSPAEAVLMAQSLNSLAVASAIFGPVENPLANYEDFFASPASRLHHKAGTKAAKSKPDFRSFRDRRPRIKQSGWSSIMNRVGRGRVIKTVRLIEIPRFGTGMKRSPKLFGRLVNASPEEAPEIAKSVFEQGIWDRFTDFMLGRKEVQSMARSTLAPTQGSALGQLKSVARDPQGRIDTDADKERRSEADRLDKLKKIRRKARRLKRETAQASLRGEGPTLAFDAFVREAAEFLGIPVDRLRDGAEYAFDNMPSSLRSRIGSMGVREFDAFVDSLGTTVQKDAARAVRVGIKGPGLTERLNACGNPALVEMISTIHENVFGYSLGARASTRLVSRLRRCLA